MAGLKFKFNPANEGDAIILDSCDAIIVKIGLRESVFGVYIHKDIHGDILVMIEPVPQT